ncbi:gloverin-like [Anticarsia gemmatalis]|uniref:gloverin-like n=1 Tax=Anticarsia gemmatalis TaxID=129554 RepID=UPI003F76C247
MQSITLVIAAVLACAYAQVSIPPGYDGRYPYAKTARHPRDLTWERNAGGGKVFGTLGGTDDSLYGRGGYKHDIFNDHRGRLEGQAYGSRVLSPYGDSSNLGGKLNWSNDNARLGADLQKQIGGRTGLTVTGEGSWKLDRNTRFSTGGNLHKTFGHSKPEFGLQGRIEHDF